MNRLISTLISSAVLACLAPAGHAALNAVDPGPYTADTGFFPHWYQDTQAIPLDLCLSLAVSSRVPPAAPPAYMCTILPNPGIFDDTLPIVFPTNFPDESFYFSASAAIDNTTVPNDQNTCVSYGAHIEAAFGGGVPAPNDQVTFSRIRIRVNVPVTGTYTITHPYGVETAVATTARGNRGCNGNQTDISITRDIGIGAPGVFTGALAGDVGPFLRSVNGPYSEGAEIFIGDPNLTTNVDFNGVPTPVAGEPVTGSPFGTNFLRIQGPAGSGVDVQSDLFVVSGKIFPATLPTPLTILRTDYSSTLLGPFVLTEVFANAPSTATVSFTDAALNTTPMTDLNANAEFYGTDSVNSPVPLSSIEVTASNIVNNPANFDTTLSSTLVDLVTITSATYSLGTGQLTVVAVSSDEVGAPLLTLTETGDTGSGAAGVTFAPTNPLTIPPATVTVTSANGGSDTEAVVLIP